MLWRFLDMHMTTVLSGPRSRRYSKLISPKYGRDYDGSKKEHSVPLWLRESPSDFAHRMRSTCPKEQCFEAIISLEKKRTFVLGLKDILQRQNLKLMDTDTLGKMRHELELVRKGTRKVSRVIADYPAAFELHRGVEENRTLCGFTKRALQLLEEEKSIICACEGDLVMMLRKLVMMTIDKRLSLDKLMKARVYLGLPYDFQQNLLPKYPHFFHVLTLKGCLFLELVCWDPAIAVSALESNALEYKEEMKQEHVTCTSEEKLVLGKDGAMTSRCLGQISADETESSVTDSDIEGSMDTDCRSHTLYKIQESSWSDSDIDEKAGHTDMERNLGNSLEHDINIEEEPDPLHKKWEPLMGDSDIGAKVTVPDAKANLNALHKSGERYPSLSFYWKTKKCLQRDTRGRAKEIKKFQSAPYISPYKNFHELSLDKKFVQREKFAVGIIHEFLSLTLEKRCPVEKLILFATEYRLPYHLLDLLQKYDGIFYVIDTDRTKLVLLKEAYHEGRLIERTPRIQWNDHFVHFACQKLKSPPQCIQ